MIIGTMNSKGIVELKVPFDNVLDVCTHHGSILVVPTDYMCVLKTLTDQRLQVDNSGRVVTLGFVTGRVSNGYLNIYPDLVSDMFRYDTCWYKGFKLKFANKIENIPRRPGMHTRVSEKGRIQIQYYFSICADTLTVEFTEAVGWKMTQEVYNAFNSCLSNALPGLLSNGVVIFESTKTGSVKRWISRSSSKLTSCKSYACPRYVVDSLSRLSSYSGQLDSILRNICSIAMSEPEDLNISFMQFCIGFVKLVELSICMGDSGLDINALLACQKMRKIAQSKGYISDSVGLKDIPTFQKLSVVSEYLLAGDQSLEERITLIGKMRNMYVHTPLTFVNKGLTDSLVRVYMIQCAYIALILKLRISGIKVNPSSTEFMWQHSKIDLYDDLKANLQSLKASVACVTWSQDLWRSVLYKTS